MSKETPTFKEALQKFIHIGEVYFRGHYHDNALNIFNELTEEDRKVLLRTMYQVYFLVEKGVIENPLETGQRRMEGVTEDPAAPTTMTASGTFIIAMLFFFIFILIMLFVVLGMDPGGTGGSSFQYLIKLITFGI